MKDQQRHQRPARPDAAKDEDGKRPSEIPMSIPESDVQSQKPKGIDWDMKGRRPKYMGKSPPTNNQ